MNKQDASNIRSFAEVERRLKGATDNFKTIQQNIYQTNDEIKNILGQVIINLKDDVPYQGDISLWFFEGTPTLENKPYTDWQTPTDHIGDLYYDRLTGYVYQFSGTGWTIKDSSDLRQALALTNAQMEENDTEKKVFFETPSDYETGDWWIKEDGTLYICLPYELTGNPIKDFAVNTNYVAQTVSNDKEELIKQSHRIIETETSIDQIFEEIGDRRYKTSSITQDIDNIQSIIQDVALYKREVEGLNGITLPEAQEDEILKLIISGTGKYVTNLYPREDLYCGSSVCNDEYGGEL